MYSHVGQDSSYFGLDLWLRLCILSRFDLTYVRVKREKTYTLLFIHGRIYIDREMDFWTLRTDSYVLSWRIHSYVWCDVSCIFRTWRIHWFILVWQYSSLHVTLYGSYVKMTHICVSVWCIYIHSRKTGFIHSFLCLMGLDYTGYMIFIYLSVLY